MLIATAACSTEQIPVASPAQIPVVSPAQMPVAAISKGPVPARRSGLTGSALYAMTLTRAGDVVGLELVKSSDNAKVAPEAERR